MGLRTVAPVGAQLFFVIFGIVEISSHKDDELSIVRQSRQVGRRSGDTYFNDIASITPFISRRLICGSTPEEYSLLVDHKHNAISHEIKLTIKTGSELSAYR